MSHLIHLEGQQPQLGDLLIMVTDHLLPRMILQVGPPPKVTVPIATNQPITPMEKVTSDRFFVMRVIFPSFEPSEKREKRLHETGN